MDEDNNRQICLKLADKSFYSLYHSGQAGERKITLSPAVESQEKNEISLFDCTGGKNLLLRDILLENPGDMDLIFSLGQGYLSYQIRNHGSEELLDKGLIELAPEGYGEGSSLTAEGKKTIREKERNPQKRGLVFFSVILSLGILLFGGFLIVNHADRAELPRWLLRRCPPGNL